MDKVHEKSLERNLSTDKIFSQPPECLAELAYCLGFKDTNRIEISLEVEVFYETYRKVFENEDDPDRKFCLYEQICSITFKVCF